MTQEKGIIEEIVRGHKELVVFGHKILSKEKPDRIYIMRHNTNGLPFIKYKQLGTIEVARPHTFCEGNTLNVTIENKKITAIEKTGKESSLRFILHSPPLTLLFGMIFILVLYYIYLVVLKFI